MAYRLTAEQQAVFVQKFPDAEPWVVLPVPRAVHYLAPNQEELVLDWPTVAFGKVTDANDGLCLCIALFPHGAPPESMSAHRFPVSQAKRTPSVFGANCVAIGTEHGAQGRRLMTVTIESETGGSNALWATLGLPVRLHDRRADL